MDVATRRCSGFCKSHFYLTFSNNVFLHQKCNLHKGHFACLKQPSFFCSKNNWLFIFTFFAFFSLNFFSFLICGYGKKMIKNSKHFQLFKFFNTDIDKIKVGTNLMVITLDIVLGNPLSEIQGNLNITLKQFEILTRVFQKYFKNIIFMQIGSLSHVDSRIFH